MHKKGRKNRKNRRLYKGMASLLIAALLISQSNLLMQAEENMENVPSDIVAAIEEESEDSVEDESVDTGTETETETETETVPDDNTNEGAETPDPNEEAENPAPDKETEDSDVNEDAVSPVTGDTFTYNQFIFKIIDADNRQVQVTGHEDGTSASGALTIPSEASYGDVTYAVVSIGSRAFVNCTNLENVSIPDTVTSIGDTAFGNCHNLADITIPNGITSIGEKTFISCESLTSVTIPANVTSIGNNAFWGCTNLGSVILENDHTSLGNSAFSSCNNLTNLIITLTSSPVNPPTIESTCFSRSDGIHFTFRTKDGAELTNTTVPTLAEAVEAYNAAYGGERWFQNIPDLLPQVPDTYAVNITVTKDGSAWNNSDRKFALLDSNNNYIDIFNVPDGTYTIYDITDAENYVNTTVTAVVAGDNVEATVKYYTVAFWDEDSIIDVILVPSDTTINKLPAPEKKGYTFSRWEDEGNNEFTSSSKVTGTMNIHAIWTEDSREFFTIKTVAHPGGSITGPAESISNPGEYSVKSGESLRFTITPDEGYRVSAILVDGKDELSNAQTADYTRAGISDGENNVKYYDFEDVTGSHTLEARFEKIQSGGGTTGGSDGNNVSGSSGGSSDSSSGSGSNSGDSGSGDNGSGDGGTNSDASGGSNSAVSFDMSAASDAGVVATNNSVPASGDKEPKTGDAPYLQVYATIAMIAGCIYLLLYFMDGKCGITEEEKREIIAKLVKWGEKGKRVRKYAALAAIFLFLVYYHAIGKQTVADWKEAYEG